MLRHDSMTELLLNDALEIDRINPYTATGTFGVSYNGGDGKYGPLRWTAPDEGPATWDVTQEVPDYVDHSDPTFENRSGPMYLKEGGTNPATSFLFPARKYQYDDGTTSWSREVVMTSGENYTNENPFFKDELGTRLPILIIFIVLLLLFVAGRVIKT